MSKNSLTTLIGQYSSDSENEDESSNVSGLNGKDIKAANDILPTTHWTQCNDPNTGHPYYWNVETKEVTWEPPADYENYLYSISKMFKKVPDDCWIRGYSQAVQAPYYVNEYTRVVSWDRPKNFKESEKKPPNEKSTEKVGSVQSEKKLIDKNSQSNLVKQNKSKPKKHLPPHLEHNSDDEKIELISSYSGIDSSSDEDIKRKYQKDMSPKIANRHLVAAYVTDESDSEIEEHAKNSRMRKPTEAASEEELRNERQIREEQAVETITQDKNDIVDKEIPNSSNIQPNSFSNIIVGGVSESTIDEEIMRLKKELEKDLGSFENESEKQDKVPEVNDGFDEKTFQRKKRIQFRTSSKSSENGQTNTNFSKIDSAKEKEKEKRKEKEKGKEKYNLYKHFQRSHVEFENTKGNEVSLKLGNEDEAMSPQLKEVNEEIDDLSDLISGKVKFLAVGHPDVTAVQAMHIQLETLLAAFRCSALESGYFFKWLKATSDDLINLEQNACPEGWKCMWDRESSQYCYKNLVTGDVQWEFPEKTDEESQADGIAGGEDEMDISTTPPPNENEQLKIENEVPPWDECNPPPPPIISVQAPPPPPNINCELASFYSDIATIETPDAKGGNNQRLSPTREDLRKRIVDDSNLRKKRKKAKVHGLGLKTKEVSNMVANWKKAQKELDN